MPITQLIQAIDLALKGKDELKLERRSVAALPQTSGAILEDGTFVPQTTDEPLAEGQTVWTLAADGQRVVLGSLK